MIDETIPLPMSPRTGQGEANYQAARSSGYLEPLEIVASIKQWEHWRLIPNAYPYRILYKAHHMLLPRRAGVVERSDLNDDERQEFERILKEFVYPTYDLWFENSPKRRSMAHIYHVHVATYWDRRDQMKLYLDK